MYRRRMVTLRKILACTLFHAVSQSAIAKRIEAGPAICGTRFSAFKVSIFPTLTPPNQTRKGRLE